MMKTLLFLLFSLPVFANSVNSFQLSGIDSTIVRNKLVSSDPTDSVDYAMTYSFGRGSGTFALYDGNITVLGTLGSSSLADGIFTGAFTGTEKVRLKWDLWALYLVTGTLQQQVTLQNGTGTIHIASSVFGGDTSGVPEPGTWIMVGIGLLLIWRHTSAGYRLKRCG